MSKGAITLTIVFEGMNLNRDEGVGGNIQTLKKLHRGDGLVHTFMSRQALRHAISKKLIDEFGWKETPVTLRGEGAQTNQFDMTKANIVEYEEMDFFGYMYTISGENAFVRTSPCRLTPAISLEKFSFDQSFNANHEMVKRAVKSGGRGIPNPWQTEDHLSLYKYSVVIDLDRIGRIDEKEKKIVLDKEEAIKFLKGYGIPENEAKKIESLEENKIKEYSVKYGETNVGKIVVVRKTDSYEIEIEINLPAKEKVNRIVDFLKAIKTLSRGIQGSISSLSPLFVIGGIVRSKTPLAHPLVELEPNTSRKLNKGLIDYACKLLEENIVFDKSKQSQSSQNQEPQGQSSQTQESQSQSSETQDNSNFTGIIKGIVKEKFENGNEFNGWKTPSEAIDEIIKFIQDDKFKNFLRLKPQK